VRDWYRAAERHRPGFGVEVEQIAAAVRSEYSPNLLAGIDAALVPTAVDRPQSIAHWREVFASGIGPGSSATRILPQRAAERSRRRNLWIGAAAATLLVVAGGSYVALRPAPPPVMNAAEVEARQHAEAEATARRAEEERSRAAPESRMKEAEAARRAAEDDRSRLEQAEKSRQDGQRKAEEEARQKAEQKAAEEAQRAAEANDEKKAEATEMALRLSVNDRQHLQVALTSLGFDTRGNDGALGITSERAQLRLLLLLQLLLLPHFRAESARL
jgi:pyruvate/2-oxoglutarate dehydrogenase complex dihydrolipoamide acyltransferase (E2) component